MEGMTLWIKVSDDIYELPEVVATTARALADRCGVKESTVKSAVSKCKKNGWKCHYIRVEVEDI
jgi:hypothetical protein